MMETKTKVTLFIAYFLTILILILYTIQGIHSAYYYTDEHPFDVIPSLVATKNLIENGIDPYSERGRHLIEQVYYGHILTSSERLKLHQEYYYPLYAVFLYVPLQSFSINNALAIIYIVNISLFILSCLIWNKLLNINNKLLSLLTIMFILMWPMTYNTLQFRNPIFFVIFFITLSFYILINSNNKYLLILSGMLLFYSTIKPQSSLLPIGYIFLIWLPIFGNRSKLIYVSIGFISIALLSLLITYMLLPVWIGGFLGALSEYRNMVGPESLAGNGAISLFIGIVLFIIGILMVLICYNIHDKLLHITIFSYIQVIQGFIFPTFWFAVLMGIPILFIVIKQYDILSKYKNVLKNSYVIATITIFSLITTIVMARWLMLASQSRTLRNLISVDPKIASIISRYGAYHVLLLLIILSIILFLLRYCMLIISKEVE